jgi:N-acetylmuramoyl-L-alanine amidase
MPVADIASALKSKSDQEILAICCWGEARGCAFAGKLGVAFVVINRVKSGSEFGNGTVYSVVTKPYAFSCFNEHDPNYASICRLFAYPDLYKNQSAWADCWFAASLVLEEKCQDITLNALFYHDARLAGPPADWGPVQQTVVLSGLMFYRRET